ncbi:hypothetical protein WNY37_09675 [Henriciella sp. AS95]|uniref:hypothetical protein n=1 Tax=Henriciella sp. AS95 TaxID=3135782 RepID=UPI0031827682
MYSATTPILVRYVAMSLTAFILSGAVAMGHEGDGESRRSDAGGEYEALNRDPYKDLTGSDLKDGAISFDVSPIDNDRLYDGPGNNVVIVQKGNANTVTVRQDGENNLLMSSQSSFRGGNVAEVVQSGNLNSSTLLQYGDDNLYALQQTGNDNWSAATQYGDGNVFEHIQTGDRLGFAITQYGESAIKVTQSGGR